jgi:anti-sigma regulatory factor (Ser/Thr protein kinase)
MSDWWRAWAGEAGLPRESLDDGELCLNEAVTNIILHGHRTDASVPLAITFEPLDDAVQMTITDHLSPFNPLEHPVHTAPTSLDQARPGGLGIHIMRVHAAGMAYHRSDDQNTLTLVFKR